MYKVSLAAARVNAGLSQTGAAKAVGVGLSTIRNWENGTTFPKQPMIERLCEVYNVPFDLLDFSRRQKIFLHGD